jgi:hypothetical protein
LNTMPIAAQVHGGAGQTSNRAQAGSIGRREVFDGHRWILA